jgi:hypothetical protein
LFVNRSGGAKTNGGDSAVRRLASVADLPRDS